MGRLLDALLPFSALVFAEFLLPGSYPNVRIANGVEELSIAINPQSPNNILVGAQGPCRFYTSFDSGNLWNGGLLPARSINGDPAVVFNYDGSALYSYIDLSNQTGGGADLHVKRSIDGGNTWPIDVIVAARDGSIFEDKPLLAVDRSLGASRGNIYISWTEFDVYMGGPQDSSRILFSRSIDGGLTFSAPIKISDLSGDSRDSSDTVEGAIPAVASDGTVYVAWTGPRGIQLDRSDDHGLTFGGDRVISDQPGGWDFDVAGVSRYSAWPILKVDLSLLHPNRLYLCWSDKRNGDVDVFVTSSDDGGLTWSQPVRVNDDQLNNGKDQFFPWMDVDPTTGSVYVVFYDRRESQDNLHTDVYLATSLDGGASFANEKISESPFLAKSTVFMGDYIGIAAQSNVIRPV